MFGEKNADIHHHVDSYMHALPTKNIIFSSEVKKIKNNYTMIKAIRSWKKCISQISEVGSVNN